MKKTLLYLGYVGFGNLGDEVCYQAFLQWAKPLETYADIMCYNLNERKSIAEIQRTLPLAGVIIGGGSLLQGSAFAAPAAEAANAGLPIWLFGTGIDYLTEAYARQLMDSSLPVTEPQMFDGKELKEEALRTVIQTCRYAGVRGPLTQRFLSHLTGKEMTVIGDPALIYHPGDDTSLLADYPELTGRFAALNWGETFGSLFGFNAQRTMADTVQGARHLISGGYKLLIFPMWPNDIDPCQRFYKAIGQTGLCMLAEKVYPADAICTMLKKAEMCVGFKLHASVLSARMGTPFVSVAYRSKCLDFALSVGYESYCISAASPHIFNCIIRLAAELPQNRPKLSQVLAGYCDAYKQRYAELLIDVQSVLT